MSRAIFDSWDDQRRLVKRLAAAWAAVIVLGYIGLRQPGVMVNGQRLSHDRAVFLAINAGTLTGFQQAVGMNEFNADSSRGPAIVMGLVLSSSLFSLIIGSLAVVRIVRLEYRVWQVAWGAVSVLLLATVAGASILIGPHRSLYDAVLQSSAAFSNCGLATGRISSIFNVRTYALLSLSVLGGLGLPVLMELYDGAWFGRKLSKHGAVTIRLAAGFYLAGFVLLFLLQIPTERGVPWQTWQQALASSSVEATNSRTGGMHFESIQTIPRSAQWVLVLLMAVGAGSAGTGSGLKLTTVAHLWRGVGAALRGEKSGRAFGIAAVWLGIYVALVAFAFIALLALERDVPADRLLFLVVSAASNVGLSHEPVNTVGAGLWLLSAVMLLGRAAPLGILWWMANTTTDADMAVG